MNEENKNSCCTAISNKEKIAIMQKEHPNLLRCAFMINEREFKPGDRVKIKSWDEICKDYAEGKLDSHEVSILNHYCDMEFTIAYYDNELDGYGLFEIDDFVFDGDLLIKVGDSDE